MVRLWRKKLVSTGASSVASSRSSLQGIWSGPDALLGFMPSRSFFTPSSLMTRLSMGGYAGSYNLVSWFGSSLSWVKTDLNCSARMSHFAWRSQCSWPCFFSAETPRLSCFWLCTYFQNSLLFPSSNHVCKSFVVQTLVPSTFPLQVRFQRWQVYSCAAQLTGNMLV